MRKMLEGKKTLQVGVNKDEGKVYFRIFNINLWDIV